MEVKLDVKTGVHSIRAKEEPFYVMTASSIPVIINNAIKARALIDTNTELNIMTEEIIKK